MTKLIFFDLDNTLLVHENDFIPHSVKGCIEKLHEKGIMTAIATGRWKARITDETIETLKPDYIISSNGQIIYDGKYNILKEEPVDSESIHRMKDFCFEHKAQMYMKFPEGCYIYNWPDSDEPDGTYIPDRYSWLSQHNDYNNNEHNLGGWFNSYTCPQQEIEALFPKLSFYALGKNGYDFNSKGVGKYSAITWLVDKLGIPLDECMAFGDADSDIEMLKMVGIGVAMGNGEKHVKAIADYVTDDLLDDGIKKALEHFKLI